MADIPNKRIFIWLEQLKRYKYAGLILILGIGLLLMPGNKEQKTESDPITSDHIATQDHSMEEKLAQLLCKIEGAGRVQVMLTLEQDYRYSYQTDKRIYSDPSEQEQEETTVVISDQNGSETPVVVGSYYPVYKGAVIVCEGADSPCVTLNIIHAVSDLTGLGSDKISVIKMKSS